MRKKLKQILALFLSVIFTFSTPAPIYAGLNDRIDGRKNIAPDASFDLIKKSPVDIIVLTDYEGQKLTDLRSKLTDLEINLSKNSDVNINYIDNSSQKVSIGRKLESVPVYKYGIGYNVTGTYDEEFSGSGSTHSYTGLIINDRMALDAVEKLPWEAQPSPYPVYIDPANVIMNPGVINENNNWGTGSNSIYIRTNNYSVPGHTGEYKFTTIDNYSYSTAAGSGGHNSTRTITSGLNFAFDNMFKYLSSSQSAKTYDADIKGWDINSNINAMNLRANSNTVVVFATEKSDTNYYSYGSYNPDIIKNYKLANMRDDNLGKLIRDRGALVYSISGKDIDDFNMKGYSYYEDPLYDENGDIINYGGWRFYDRYINLFTSSDATARADVSITDIITKSAAKGQSFAKDDTDSLMKALDYNLKVPSNKVDMVVASNDGNTANTLVDNVKTRLNGVVDIQSAVMNGSNAIFNDTATSPKLYNIDRVWRDANAWYQYFVLLKNGDLYRNDKLDITDVKDFVNIGSMMAHTDDNDNTDYSYYVGYSLVLKNDGSVWRYIYDYWTYTGYWEKLNFLSNIKEIGVGSLTLKDSTSTYYPTLIDELFVLDTSGNLLKVSRNLDLVVVQESGVAQLKGNFYRRNDNSIIEMNRTFFNTGVYANSIKDYKLIAGNGPGYCLTDNGTLILYSAYFVGESSIVVQDVKNVVQCEGTSVIYTKLNGDVIYRYEYMPNNNTPSIVEAGYIPHTFKTHSSLRDLKVFITDESSGQYANYYRRMYKFTDGTVIDNFSGSRKISDIISSDGNNYIAVDLSGEIWGIHDYIDLTGKSVHYNYHPKTIVPNYVTVNVPALNTNILNNFSFRSDSEKYFIYISNSVSTTWTKGIDSVFPFDTLNDAVINKLRSNGVIVYIVTPEQAMDMLLRWPDVDNIKQTQTLRNMYNALPVEHGRFGSWNEIADSLYYRYSVLIGKDPNSVYLIYGEDSLAYSVNYSDFESDPKYDLRWKYDHDANYFENGLGVEPYSGTWQNSEKNSFTKVGLYTMVCQARDNPLNDNRFDEYRLWGPISPTAKVYVHRRPVADFQVTLRKSGDGYATSISDSSYDLDKMSTANRGIISWRWRYRVSGTSEWYNTVLPGYLPKGLTYDVSLEVLDQQGAWSRPKLVTVDTTAVNLVPTVDADPTYAEWTNQDVNITVTADDNGENDFNRIETTTTTSWTAPSWVDNTWYQKIVPIKYTQDGIWYLFMKVFDNAGNNSYKFRGPYKIDKTPPGGTAVPYSTGWTNQDVNMTFSPWDNLSGVNRWRYTVSSNNGASWGAWSGYAWGPAPSSVTFNYEGIHKLMAEVTDNAGNINYVTTGNYLIDKTAPIITPDKNGPIEVFDSITVNLNISDNLSGVRETRYAFTQSTEKPLSGWFVTASTNIAAATNQEGTWYLHVESTDNAGNTSYAVIGSFKVIIVRVYDLTVTLINDITWKDYYFEGSAYNQAGNPTQFTKKSNTDIKASRMPINKYNESKLIDFTRDGIDSGCEVNFYLRSIGNPVNVVVIAHYITEEGEKTVRIQPKSGVNELWEYNFIIPLECKIGTFISFDVEAYKNGNVYGTDRWVEPWLPQNSDRKIFYISGNVLDRLKFNQSY